MESTPFSTIKKGLIMKKTAFNEDWIFENRKITLPHDAMQEQGRAADALSGSGSAFYLGGVYTYQKIFFAPEEWEGKDIILEFEGIYPRADIYLNGIKKGSCTYGYRGCRFQLEELEYTKENVIKVVVDGSRQPDSRWYPGAGIYRPVWLWSGAKEHIRPEGIRITTLSTETAQISVEIAHTAVGCCKEDIEIEVSRHGEVVAHGCGERVMLKIPDAQLWDSDHPNLYQCSVILKKEGKVIDRQSTGFGIRQLTWSENGFMVNGKMVLLKGGCIHHDNGILGARSFAESEWRRIRKLKENGFNAVRSSHNPVCVSLLEACDALGMYVIDEGWDMWYKAKNDYDYAGYFENNYIEDIEYITRKDYNHPSVIMYSIGNEVSEPCEEKGVRMGTELVRLFHEKDPSRPVTAGINITLLYMAAIGMDADDNTEISENTDMDLSAASQMNSTVYNEMVSSMGSKMNMAAASDAADRVASPILDILDIAGYNYASSRYGIEGDKHPGRIIVGSETFPQDLPANWKQVETYPYLIGDFMWTAWDYLGEVGVGAWTWEKDGMEFKKKYPWLLADTGAFDILGNDNAEAGMASVVWGQRKTPYIGVVPMNHGDAALYKAAWRGTNALPYWSYQGCNGNPAQVEVYSMGYEAELYVNDTSQGRLKLQEGKAVFHTVYEPGILKAIAYDENGVYLSESSLCSADEATKISIRPEKAVVRIGEILYVDISLTGENGEVECNRDACLTVTVEGGELLAYGSANPRTEESFLEGKYTTYYGRSQAVVRISSPQVRIMVCGKELEPASLTIEV